MELLALDIWNILIQYNITCPAYHLPGCENYNFDPSAWKVDAFTFHWPNNIYVFPPLSQISEVLNKIWSDEVENLGHLQLHRTKFLS